MTKYTFRLAGMRGAYIFHPITLIPLLILVFLFGSGLVKDQDAELILILLAIFVVVFGRLIHRVTSFLKIEDGNLYFIKNFKESWQMPINNIKTVEENIISRDWWNTRPKAGIRIRGVGGQSYEAHYLHHLHDFEKLAEDLRKVNLNIEVKENPELEKWKGLKI